MKIRRRSAFCKFVAVELLLSSPLEPQLSPTNVVHKTRATICGTGRSCDNEYTVICEIARGQNGTTNGTQQYNGSRQRRATLSQVRALRAIADRQQIDLLRLLNERFQFDDPAQLGIGTAS